MINDSCKDNDVHLIEGNDNEGSHEMGDYDKEEECKEYRNVIFPFGLNRRSLFIKDTSQEGDLNLSNYVVRRMILIKVMDDPNQR